MTMSSDEGRAVEEFEAVMTIGLKTVAFAAKGDPPFDDCPPWWGNNGTIPAEFAAFSHHQLEAIAKAVTACLMDTGLRISSERVPD